MTVRRREVLRSLHRCVGAVQVKNLRSRYGSAGNRDDRFDAYVLADTLPHQPRTARPRRRCGGPAGAPRPTRLPERFLGRRGTLIDALADSLVFQFGDWDAPAPSDGPPPPSVGDETGLPVGADRDLMLEAQAIGAHAFLTRDREILERTTLSGPPMAVLAPRTLADELAAAGVLLFFGGMCGDGGCPYANWPLPAPDMGKWSGLLDVLK